MSDNWIALIPENPDYEPDQARQEAARARFIAIAPEADEITIIMNDNVQFFDCGANFERIICPACEREINISWWQKHMDEDYGDAGFKLDRHVLPCCGASRTLAQLNYEWPQGFARFAIDARNPRIGELSEEQRCEFERILGTPIKAIYQLL